MIHGGIVQVALFHGRGLISRLIRWQTRSYWSHAALTFRGTNLILESWQGSGVRMRELEDWTDVQRFEVAGIDALASARAWEYGEARVGQGYDYWGVLRFLSRRGHPDDERLFCSELVFAAIQSAGIDLLSRIPASHVSPALLAISPRLSPVSTPTQIPK